MNESVSVRLMEAGTPETNGREFPMFPPNSYGEMFVVYSDFARKLERERDEIKSELAKLKESAKSVIEIWETPPWKIDATPSKAITQLRDAIGYED